MSGVQSAGNVIAARRTLSGANLHRLSTVLSTRTHDEGSKDPGVSEPKYKQWVYQLELFYYYLW